MGPLRHLRADAAVLYRSNAQSRVLEEGLINAGIPYRVPPADLLPERLRRLEAV